LVPSPKVKTYDLKPEMSAVEVTDKLVEAIESEEYDLIVVNYANTDMVGHTGHLGAAIKAVEAVDACVDRVQQAVQKQGGAMLITADHGNAELMHNDTTGDDHTAHTTNLVPVIAVSDALKGQRLQVKEGKLADIAPTILTLMGIAIPEAMSGNSLLSDA
jgi:2,3-bisphosphoglycerate-independent phosphoglycerate mutase